LRETLWLGRRVAFIGSESYLRAIAGQLKQVRQHVGNWLV